MADGPAGFTRGSTCPALLRILLGFAVLRIPDCHRLWFHFPENSARMDSCRCRSPTTPQEPESLRFGLFPGRSPLLGESRLFSFPPGTKMFQFPGLASLQGIAGLQPAGLPHSGIRGSQVACTYPRLIAACHAFRRLLEPRHPPYALAYFRLRPRRLAPWGTCIYLGFSLFVIAFCYGRLTLQPHSIILRLSNLLSAL